MGTVGQGLYVCTQLVPVIAMRTTSMSIITLLVCLSLQVWIGAAATYDCDCKGCSCTNPDNPRDCMCPDCMCLTPKTVCGDGFTKVCPEKIDGCNDGETTICKEDTLEAAEAIPGLLSGVTASRKDFSIRTEERKLKWLEPSNRGDTIRHRVRQEIKCDGIPKFRCDFYIDYIPYGEVVKFRAGRCTHKKNFSKCKITIPTDSGCEVTTNIYNKRGEVHPQGKMRLLCPETTPAATITAPATTASTTENPYGHAGEGIKVIGDGCQCIPDSMMSLHQAASARAMNHVEYKEVAQVRDDTSGQNMTRTRITKEIKCFTGIPIFTCIFSFDSNEFCDKIMNFRARNCTHRVEFERCPVTLETDQGCKIKTKITTKGYKMLVSPNTSISGGMTRTKGFLENCVCLSAPVSDMA